MSLFLLGLVVQESALEVLVEWPQFGSRFWPSTQGETPNSNNGLEWSKVLKKLLESGLTADGRQRQQAHSNLN